MKEYLSSIIIISIAICIFELLAPNNENFIKYIRLIGALCIICVIISPLNLIQENLANNFLDDLKDKLTENSKEDLGDEYTNILNEYLNNHSIEAYNNQIKELLTNNFDIPNNECEVNTYTNFTNEKLTITEIQILLRGNSIFKNPYEIEEFITKICGVKCKVLIK